jgi:AraC-like DNA-binding protein
MTATVSEPWAEAMATTFGHLLPSALGDRTADGRVSRTPLGRTCAFDVRGSAQVLRRTATSIRLAPADLLKVVAQRAGSAVVRQGDREVLVRPGELALYDTGRPYEIVLGPGGEDFRSTVLTLPRGALRLSWCTIAAAMARAVPATEGAGCLFLDLLDGVQASGVETVDAHLGEAGLHLLAGALESCAPPARDHAAPLRESVRRYIRAHIAEPDLGHDSVARAYHLSPRSLHRLFADEQQSVSELIRAIRLEGVRGDLANPADQHRPVMAVAARWGFRDQAHLTRAFRAAYGTTPAAYRRGG